MGPIPAPRATSSSTLLTAPDTGLPVGNVYDKAGTRHPLERRMVASFNAALASLLPARAQRVLDVGCGEGHHLDDVARAIPDAVTVGLDAADPAWLAAWHPPMARVVVGDAVALPFGDAAFDLVLALEVLEHLTDPCTALAEIARVGSGDVILSVPWEPVWRAGNLARGRYVRDWGNTPGHLQHFTRRGFRRVVEHHFHIEAVRRPVPWTLVRARPHRPNGSSPASQRP